jgi:hypothetical protein
MNAAGRIFFLSGGIAAVVAAVGVAAMARLRSRRR